MDIKQPLTVTERFLFEVTIMKVRDVVILFFVVCTIGCAHNVTGGFYKPGVDFAESKKIAVMKFKNTDHPASGQEAADLMAMAFLKNGFDLIEINQILSPSEQDKIYQTGLTAEVKTNLKNFEVDAVILGTINEYYCSNVSSFILNLFNSYRHSCRVTFSVKMIDLISGEILWGLSISDEQDGDNLKAEIVLRSMIREMDKEIPVYLSKQINQK
jgi:hypothetical protein